MRIFLISDAGIRLDRGARLKGVLSCDTTRTSWSRLRNACSISLLSCGKEVPSEIVKAILSCKSSFRIKTSLSPAPNATAFDQLFLNRKHVPQSRQHCRSVLKAKKDRAAYCDSSQPPARLLLFALVRQVCGIVIHLLDLRSSCSGCSNQHNPEQNAREADMSPACVKVCVSQHVRDLDERSWSALTGWVCASDLRITARL